MGTGLLGPHTLHPQTPWCRQDRTWRPLRNSRPCGQCSSHTADQQIPTDCSTGSEGPTVTSQKPCSLCLLHPKAGAEWGPGAQNGGYKNLTPVPNTCQTATAIKNGCPAAPCPHPQPSPLSRSTYPPGVEGPSAAAGSPAQPASARPGAPGHSSEGEEAAGCPRPQQTR